MLAAVARLQTYIFKFSSLEQSSAITSGCTKYTTAAMMTCGKSGNQQCIPCGVQKTGIMWGENIAGTFPIGDSTLSAEVRDDACRHGLLSGRRLWEERGALGYSTLCFI